MAEYRPLVRINGQTAKLPDGDSLVGVSAGGGVPHVIAEGATFQTAENMVTSVDLSVRHDGVWIIDGVRFFR